MKQLTKYSCFKYDSRNTGCYTAAYETLTSARMYAKKNGHCRIDGRNGFFEDYENGEMTSWSVIGHKSINFPKGFDAELLEQSEKVLAQGEHPFNCSCARCNDINED